MNKLFIDAMDMLINLSYPDKQIDQKESVPLYMPLKVMFHGDQLVGKSTHTGKLA